SDGFRFPGSGKSNSTPEASPRARSWFFGYLVFSFVGYQGAGSRTKDQGSRLKGVVGWANSDQQGHVWHGVGSLVAWFFRLLVAKASPAAS
ncbi:MAG TPA: hypothetical protein VJ904_11020, partial [Tichowtungia sp.]|nr:hypothetical protein [Tichowtungia sp.]